MSYLKYICLALLLSSPVGAFEVGDPMKVSVVCKTEDAIMKWAMADIESMAKTRAAMQETNLDKSCQKLGRPFKAIVNQVIMDYKDHTGKPTQVLKVKLVHPMTGQLSSVDFYILGLVDQGI